MDKPKKLTNEEIESAINAVYDNLELIENNFKNHDLREYLNQDAEPFTGQREEFLNYLADSFEDLNEYVDNLAAHFDNRL